MLSKLIINLNKHQGYNFLTRIQVLNNAPQNELPLGFSIEYKCQNSTLPETKIVMVSYFKKTILKKKSQER